MRVLIDIGHPAHVHYFKNIANHFLSNGGAVLFTSRDKEVTISLLKNESLPFRCIGKARKSLVGKIFGQFFFTLKLLIIAIRFRPDVILNSTQYAAWVAFLLKKIHIGIEDTFNMEQVKLYLPFTNAILTPDCPHRSLGKKEIRYAGYQELLYLHPSKFKPNSKLLIGLNIKTNEKIIIVRFVSWSASHDIGHKGISLRNKINSVKEFSKYGRVIISSEAKLPEELKAFSYRLQPSLLHHVMAHATLVFGESATMASEGAVLGVPGIYIDKTGRAYTTEQEKEYGMVFNFSESESQQLLAIKKAIEILKMVDSGAYFRKQWEKMILDKIDVTDFFIWFIENYPSSMKTMKENPNYQYNFK